MPVGHTQNKVFASRSAAAKGRAHEGCPCSVVRTSISEAAFVKLFGPVEKPARGLRPSLEGLRQAQGPRHAQGEGLVMRASLGLLATSVVLALVPAAALAEPVKPISSFSPRRTPEPAGDGRGAIAIVPLANDPAGPGTEYQSLQIMGVPATIVWLGTDLTPYPVVILAGTADTGSVDQATADALTATSMAAER